jgi:hypothetical protein
MDEEVEERLAGAIFESRERRRKGGRRRGRMG